MPTVTDLRARFRRLHEAGCFILPNPWDAGSARYLEHLGFVALATTSAGAAFAMGLPDSDRAMPRDAMLDRYIDGRVSRLCPEGPVPVVDVARVTEAGGGAANTAANAAALGACVSLVTAIGADANGDALLAATRARGVSTDAVLRVPGRTTLARERIVGEGRLLARCDTGTTSPIRRGEDVHGSCSTGRYRYRSADGRLLRRHRLLHLERLAPQARVSVLLGARKATWAT